MALLSGVSKEFKVGVLTVVSLTILILGYNFMLGKDNPFQRGREFKVYYDSTQGLTVGVSVVYNGFRIGQLSNLKMVQDGSRYEATIEISSDINIPKDSRMLIQSEILGGQKIKLIRGKSSLFAEDGDTLQPLYVRDQFSAMNDKILPIVSKTDSLISSMNSFFKNDDLSNAVHELPIAIRAFKTSLNEIQDLVNGARPGINKTVNNLSQFSDQLKDYDNQLDVTLKSLNRLSKQMDTVDVGLAISSLTRASLELSSILSKVSSGKGTLGQLANDDKLYKDLNRSIAELDRVLLDLKKYPEKYVPVPFTSSQRKKAKDKSAKDKQIWPDSAVKN